MAKGKVAEGRMARGAGAKAAIKVAKGGPANVAAVKV